MRKKCTIKGGQHITMFVGDFPTIAAFKSQLRNSNILCEDQSC